MTVVGVRCDITELLVGECAHCRKLPDPDATEEDVEVVPVWFKSRYDSSCARCGEPTHAGQMIAPASSGGYVGDCCKEADRG